MRKYCCFFVLSFLYSTAIFAQQSLSPGGVKAPIVWYKTDSVAVPTFHSLIGGTDSVISLPQAPPNILLNFHPSLVFNGAMTLPIRLPDSSLTNATFFVAYQSKATNSEGVVWHLSKQNKTTIVFTTNRLADLETYQYMNYRDFFLANPKIGTYTQQKLKDTVFPAKQSWNIGFKPESPRLPVFSFNGIIPEIIAYDRVLSTQERIKVGSYLAIKYGITLSDPAAIYLNSADDVIWNGIAYPSYYHNIAGIARDDSSHLVQVKATSSNNPYILTIAAAKQLVNNTSLMWGDNDKPLTNADKTPGVPVLLKKRWLLFTHNNNQSLQTDVTLDTKKLDVPLPLHPVYWLVIDRSGKGDFSLPGTEFIRMASIDKEGKALFADIKWGLNTNSTELMSITAGQDLLADISITNPLCKDTDGGSVAVKVVGGLAPFQLTLAKSAGDVVFNESFNNNKTVPIKGLAPGKYKLTLTDAADSTYTDSFYINSTDGPHLLAVAENYTLPQSGPLTIQADSGVSAGLVYEWNGPNGFHSNIANVKITIPGLYSVKCSNGTCSYQQDVSVKSYPTGMLTDKNVTVYPNPSTGKFGVSIALDQPAPVKMAIYTTDGKMVGQPQNASGMANYYFSGTIPLTGAYFLEFTSGKYATSRKLIVIN
ncbi:T9SS type A sorting domain-containing protein [Mucilaginibacter sp.]|uniref:T9SS type A sorting domain-containing protein n=1 Tax=Mucilaginibacter sp. TaxID=1882438 RepID=UPI0025DC3E99|nr:T9SS type A sorting domain-containing protein [Mucilaginibacter sp.]